MDKIGRGSGNITPWLSPPPTRQAWSRRLRPSSPASAAWRSRWTLPARAAFSMRSAPLMRLPERASMPRRSSVYWRSAASVRSPRSAGIVNACVLNARWSAALSFPFAFAASSSSRFTLIHAPRPGAFARTSGATVPSGPSASLIRSSRVPLRRVRMQVRSGRCASSPSRLAGGRAPGSPEREAWGNRPSRNSSRLREGSFTLSVSFRGVRIGGLLGLCRAVLVVEPVGSRSHDDLVALLFAEAIFGEDPALVLGPVARLLAARLDALLLDQLVSGEVGEVVERADVRLAQRHQHLLGQVRDF